MTVPDAYAIRRATAADAEEMARVEAEARAILRAHGVDLDALRSTEAFEESLDWDLALVAEADGRLVGLARGSDLGDGFLALDQVSVSPAHARRGLGRQLLLELAAYARESGHRVITGTTFASVPFNAPFYAGLDATEDPDPHPVMVSRLHFE